MKIILKFLLVCKSILWININANASCYIYQYNNQQGEHVELSSSSYYVNLNNILFYSNNASISVGQDCTLDLFSDYNGYGKSISYFAPNWIKVYNENINKYNEFNYQIKSVSCSCGVRF